MRVEDIALSRLSIPFRVPFEHASARREATETLWARVRAEGGATGRGEGCPRTYVTGETFESAAAFLRKRRGSIQTIAGLSDLRSWVEENREDIDANPASWCALELAILEVLSFTRGRSVESILGLEELAGEFRYTAVLGARDATVFRTLLSRYREVRMRDFKLKLLGNLDEDRERLRVLRSEADVDSLRLDANNLWDSRAVAAEYLESLGGGFFAVEEPLHPNRYLDLLWLADRLDVRIILDESFLRPRQLEELPETKKTFIVNVRVSKMGGLLRSLEAVGAAKRSGIPIVVGAHVGETSLLTRAALPIARYAGELLVGQEGAFGTRLLAEEVAMPPLMFGDRGALAAPQPGVGFGLRVADPPGFVSPLLP